MIREEINVVRKSVKLFIIEAIYLSPTPRVSEGNNLLFDFDFI